jgi:myosin-5
MCVCDLCAPGILPSIDEELRIPKGCDATWNEKLITTHRSNANFAPDRASASCFIVKHYAGAVTYDSAAFLEKSKDQLNDDAYSLLQTSSFKFLASLFPADTTGGDSRGGSGLAKKVSLGAKFTRQLGDLMQALNATEPHYIRCVKPNPNKAQLQYEGQMVYDQLTYAGVFEAITIRKQGFPFRLPHHEFFQRYKVSCDARSQRTASRRSRVTGSTHAGFLCMFLLVVSVPEHSSLEFE